MSMRLIVDSGSTKTDWAFVPSGASDTQYEDARCGNSTTPSCQHTVIHTRGINPVVQDKQTIASIIGDELLAETAQHGICSGNVKEVFYYGAGCTNEKKRLVEETMHMTFASAETLEVESDMLGAARALCGTRQGIAAILGTGANSCLYDGRRIVRQTPALGFILGDEGSGAYIGKRLLNGIIKGWLPEDIRECFFCETGFSVADIIDRVYHQPMPNRFLASNALFVSRHIAECPELEIMVTECFKDFIRVNILPYNSTQGKGNISGSMCTLNAVGSIAYYFKTQLNDAANSQGFQLGKIIKSPLQDLIKFHI